MFVFVCVFGVCVGADDGAQEVVKEILEDVVTSAVKGKNQELTLSSYSYLQRSLQPDVLVVACLPWENQWKLSLPIFHMEFRNYWLAVIDFILILVGFKEHSLMVLELGAPHRNTGPLP